MSEMNGLGKSKIKNFTVVNWGVEGAEDLQGAQLD